MRNFGVPPVARDDRAANSLASRQGLSIPEYELGGGFMFAAVIACPVVIVLGLVLAYFFFVP